MSDLYRELVLEHWRNPRYAVALVNPTHSATIANEQCGDVATVEVVIRSDTLRDISVQVSGCALATAAGSLLAEHIMNRSVAEIRTFNEQTMIDLLDGAEPSVSRRRCATLALEALHVALS